MEQGPKLPLSTASLTRRDVLKGAVGLATLGAGSALAADLPANATGNGGPISERERVAIIGAGAGGVAAAYFLAGTFDVDLFEARSNRRSVRFAGDQLPGASITVDVGAQFFHPDTHPIYVALLEELGVYDPDHPDARRHAGGARQPVHLPDGRGRAHLFVVAPVLDAAAFDPIRHLLTTRAAGGSVQHVQGRNGLYFSGQYTTGMDLQESAVYSAMKVAESLAPGSQALASLKARVTTRGRAGISYEL